MVIPDADIWIDLLNDADLPSSRTLRELIDNGLVGLAGVAMSEVLRGTRGQEETRVGSLLAGMPYVEMNREVWRRAGRIAAELDRKGEPIPMTDVFMAALAIEGDHELFTRDKHFTRIAGLRLYQPEGALDA